MDADNCSESACTELPPVYLEKLKGARLVYYRDHSSHKVAIIARALAALVLFTAAVVSLSCVWDHLWEDQVLFATTIFAISLFKFLTFTSRLGTVEEVTTCDHIEEHSKNWNERVTGEKPYDGIVEAGTVINWGIHYASGVQRFHGDRDLKGYSDADKIVDHILVVQWDCGYRCTYSKRHDEWKFLRVFDMGPAGLKSHVLLCDVCKESLTGFSFRCTNAQCSDNKSQIYDLCYKHYNEDNHHHDKDSHRFRVHQLYSIGVNDQNDDVLKVRSRSKRYRLVGLFPQAHVLLDDGKDEGNIVKVVHQGGQTNPRKAKYWNCVAEFKSNRNNEIQYGNIGTQGQVTMKAVVAGDGGLMYANHFPFIGGKVLNAAIDNVNSMHMLPNGEPYFISNTDGYKLLSLTDTDLQHLNHKELWNQCHGLELLNLLHNKLEYLPHSLQNHHSTLKIANMSYNCFEKVPDVTFSLQRLENLNMINNAISVIPSNISHLRNLTHLYLSHNAIFSVPNSFQSCNGLDVLCLDHNHISHIPNSIRKLPSLQTLELHHNNLQDFPLSEGDFRKLKHLSLHRNRLQVLPKSFVHLISRLDNCTLHSNAFCDAKLCTNLLKLNNCAKNRQIGKECVKFSPRKAFRVLVIGPCGSGKTSIIEVLCKEKYVTPVEKDEHNHTIGIEQHVHHFEQFGETYELSMWDFAGEDSYLMMNYLFLSEGTLIWLVVNMAEFQPESESYQTMIGKWLRAVVARVKNPSVWIIGTHQDQCSEDDLKLKKEKIYEFVAEECHSINSEPHLVSELTTSIATDEISFDSASVKVFSVSNTYSRSGFSELNEEIRSLPFSNISKLLEQLPVQWQHVRVYLREKATKNLVEEQSEVVDMICKQKFASSRSDAEGILDYFHETGDILKIADDQSKVVNIYLDVMQVIHILKQIFCHNLYENISQKLKLSREYDHRSQSDALQLVSEHGIIAEDILAKLWSSIGIHEDDIHLFINLLKTFKMAYQVNRDGEICYLFPFLLKSCTLPCRRQTNSKQITIQCEFGFIPCGLFEKLLCCCLPLLANGYKIHRNMLEGLSIDRKIKLLISCARNPTTNFSGQIEIYVEQTSSTDSSDTDYTALWQLAINIVRNLKQLISPWKKLRASMVVLCPLCAQDTHSFPFAIPPLKSSNIEIKCELGDVKVESVIPPHRLIMDDLTVEETIDLTAKSQVEVVNPKVLATVSSIISSDWTSFAQELRLIDRRKIDEIAYNCRHEGSDEMCVQMLLSWAKGRSCTTTVGDLAKAIKAHGNYPRTWVNALKATLDIDE